MQHLIFFEPVTWGMIFNGTVIGSGFDTVPGGNAYVNKSVYSFHYYCWWYYDTGMNIETCDHILLPKVFDEVLRTVKQIGGAAMLTEWGQGCDYDHGNPNNATSECSAIMDIADKYYLGWTDWYFSEHLADLGKNWALTENAQKIFSRTFAHAVAGTPEHAHFDVETKEFKLCFKPNSSSSSSSSDTDTASITEIFARMDLHYPNGIEVSSTPNLELIKIDTDNNRVFFRNRAKVPDVLGQACITLTPK